MLLYNTSIVLGYSSILPLIIIYTYGTIKSILLYLHALGIASIIYLLINLPPASINQALSMNQNEIYGLRHLLFNLKLPPKTLWFNMGLWNKEGLSFPEACENLVHTVAEKMDIRPACAVLDVGFGCGDSCIVLAEKYDSKVTGITNELSQWRIAKDRVSVSTKLQAQINLLHGSADDLEQLIPDQSVYDYVISIDSAYHYNTRWSFLKSSYIKLKNGGTVGLYDLAIEPGFLENATPFQKSIFNFVCDAVKIPIGNLVTVQTYQQQLINLGYKQVEIEQLDRQHVFGGLARSFDQQYDTVMKYGIGVSLSNRMFLKISSFLFGLISSKPWLVPIIVKAQKKEQ